MSSSSTESARDPSRDAAHNTPPNAAQDAAHDEAHDAAQDAAHDEAHDAAQDAARDPSRRIRELSTLNSIAETLNSAVDLRSALEGSLERLVELTGLTTAWVFLRREEPAPEDDVEAFYPAATLHLPPALSADQQAELRLGHCECQDLYNTGKFARAINIVHCSRLKRAVGETWGLKMHASVPLVSRDRLIGILNMVAGPGKETFTTEELELLSAVGYQIGLAVERARLYDLVKARRFEEQGALLKLSEALLRAGDLQQILDEVLRVAVDVMAGDGGAIILEAEEQRGQGWYRATLGREPERVAPASAVYLGPNAVAAATTVSGWSGRVSIDRGPTGWVVREGLPLVVTDLAADARWEHPLLAELEGFVSAAFVPLFQAGETIGALGVYCRTRKEFGSDEVRLLSLMGNQAALAIEQARLHEQALEEQRLRRELDLASEIQTSFLPDTCPYLPGWSICGYYQAARQVGGDFYDFVPLPAGRMGLVIADVADKGVPAALFMALSRTLVRATTIGGRAPREAISRANSLILADTHTDLFVTLFYGALDPATGELHYVNAGHNPPLWWSTRTRQVQRLPGRGMALGVLEEIPLEERRLTLELDDVLLLYTDGLTEALNAQGEEFGEARLLAIIAAHAGEDSTSIESAVLSAHREFTGGQPPFDDITMVVLKRTG